MNGKLTKYRVTTLEKRFKSLDEKMDEIMENHLPHIQTAVSSLKTEVRLGIGVNILMVLAGVVGIILLIK